MRRGNAAEHALTGDIFAKLTLQSKISVQKIADDRPTRPWGRTRMNYYESVVVDYLRSDRRIFVNTECCIQLNEADNPDNSGPHWYCDAVACDFAAKCTFLCEISYSKQLGDLTKRLRGWHDNWDLVCSALRRDSFIPPDWQVRAWLFVPEMLLPHLLQRLEKIGGVEHSLRFTPRITPLEMVQPWRYRSWNRVSEALKPDIIPQAMQV